MKKLIFYFCLFSLILSCKSTLPNEPVIEPIQIQEDTVSTSFMGVGAQLGGYDNLNQLIGSTTLNDADWKQLFDRLQFMRPGMVRLTGSEGWNYSIGGVYNPERSKDVLFKILDFCQANNISVIWGEWGHVGGTSGYDLDWLNRSINFLEYLVNTKGYTCIKYFTMVNEPNGDWSTINGNYTLWKSLIIKTYQIMLGKGLIAKVKLMAPDISISSGAYTGSSSVTNPFVTNTVKEINNIVGAYDYHLYPGNDQVENDKFYNTTLAYKKLLPTDKDALITELGFKYLTDSPKGILNEQLKSADLYADVSACEMVYESIYGIDMSAAIIQLLQGGYKAALVWRMDDAAYISVTTNGIKTNRWGFWNSLGSEKFGNPDDEKLRPWFFPVSLLSRFFPAGSIILNVIIPVKPGLYAIACRKDDKYTIALVNTSTDTYTFDLKMQGGKLLSNMNQYKYISLNRRNYTGEVDANGFPKSIAKQDIDLSNSKAVSLTMEGNSFMLLTNRD